jgi:hypothetical protein
MKRRYIGIKVIFQLHIAEILARHTRGQFNLFIAAYAKCSNEGQRQGKEGKALQGEAEYYPSHKHYYHYAREVVTPRLFNSVLFIAKQNKIKTK